MWVYKNRFLCFQKLQFRCFKVEALPPFPCYCPVFSVAAFSRFSSILWPLLSRVLHTIHSRHSSFGVCSLWGPVLCLGPCPAHSFSCLISSTSMASTSIYSWGGLPIHNSIPNLSLEHILNHLLDSVPICTSYSTNQNKNLLSPKLGPSPLFSHLVNCTSILSGYQTFKKVVIIISPWI